MRRGDPERIYQAQRAGFLGRMVAAHRLPQERASAVLDALEAECEAIGLDRGSREFWREAERRLDRGLESGGLNRYLWLMHDRLPVHPKRPLRAAGAIAARCLGVRQLPSHAFGGDQ